MESKNIVLALIVICLISLLLGVFNSFNRNTAVSRSKVNTGKNVSKMIVSSNKIALIKLNGIISADENSSFISDDKNAKSALNALKLALEDSSVKGVVLQINTPGGTVAMSQNLYDAIIRLRNEKPVVVSMDDIATSGGYYVASAADRIVAQNGTITGSIGVIYSNLDMHKFFEKTLNIKPNIIKTGAYKDTGSQFREMNAADKALIQSLVDDSYNQFLRAIISGRIERKDNYQTSKLSLDTQTLNKYADGRIFTGNQAKILGFVDYTGDLDLAYEICKSMAGEKFKFISKNIPLEPYGQSSNFPFSDFFSNLTSSSSSLSLENFLPASLKLNHKLLYLWE